MFGKGKKIIKNLGYSFSANAISLMISAITVAIVPKFLGVEEYGYYQLYLFYASYVGFFHLGWCDGVYLKYGGMNYESLDKHKMSSQFWGLTVFEVILSIGLYVAISLSGIEVTKRYILSLVVINLILIIPKTYLSYLLQITNRIKEYANVIIIEKVIYISVTLLVLFFENSSYYALIIADILAKISSTVLATVYCQGIVFTKFNINKTMCFEALDNIRVGMKLLLANIAGMLIIGIVRIAIENCWNIETYSKVSFAINISNQVLVFVNAVGIVLFPMIKRMSMDRVREMYTTIRSILMIFLIVVLAMYYPLQYVLLYWLPDYSESLTYMGILFPICVFECKMAMLINTYLKALRKEKIMLYANVFTVIISLIFTVFSVYICKDIVLALILLVILFGIRSTICEIYLAGVMKLRIKKDLICEIMICGGFVYANCMLVPTYALLLHMLLGMVYCWIIKDTLLNIIKHK